MDHLDCVYKVLKFFFFLVGVVVGQTHPFANLLFFSSRKGQLCSEK